MERINYITELQSIRLGFYMNKPNKSGLGKIYARYRIMGKLYRVSTGLRAKSDYWDKTTGSMQLRRDSVSRKDWIIYTTIQKELNSLSNIVDEKLECYLCATNKDLSPEGMGLDIATLINNRFKMKEKRKTDKTPLMAKLKGIVLDYDNEKTQRTLLSILATFEKFLTETGVEDNISNLNMDLMRAWRGWLDLQKYSVSRTKACINFLFTFAGKLERQYNYDFKLDKNKIEPVKDKRTQEERRNNGIALTPEEIGRLRDIDLNDNSRLIPARDMFLLQCWCGCRVEDLPLLLDSKHISRENDGNYYSTFKTQKKGVTSITPLTSLYPGAWDLVKMYADKCPFVSNSDLTKYNRQLKDLAKLAGLDRKIIYTGQKGKDKTTEKFCLYDVISSHDGRHTFITNCIREKGLTPDKIRLISGHSDTKLIESVYANLTQEDNREVLSKAIKETQGSTTGTTHTDNSKPGRYDVGLNDPGVKSPVEFCLWLVGILGINTDTNNISLPELFGMIAEKKQEIIKDYGKNRYESIKEFLGVGMGKTDKKRLELLFCRALKHPVKLLGKMPRKLD